MFTFFETKKAKLEKSHLRNLVALAKADGKVISSESDLIYKLGAARGLKENEITEILNEKLDNIEVTAPSNDNERYNQIYELVQVMLADGIVRDSEVDFCIHMGESLGFRKAFAGVVVNKIAMGISNGLDKDAIKSELESFLSF